MAKNRRFSSWDVLDSQFYPKGAVLYIERNMLKLTDFGPGEKELASCEIGTVYEVFFDEEGKLRSQKEIMDEVTRVAIYEKNIDSDYDEYFIAAEVADFYDYCEGLTLGEVLNKIETSEREEVLINND